MLDRMISDAKIEDRQFLPCEPRQLPALARGGSLFLGLHFCDWSRSKDAKPSITAIREAIAGEGSEKVVIFSERGDVPAHDLTELQNTNCRVIEEGKIDGLRLKRSLQYFCQTSNITGAGSLYSDAGFQAYFKHLITEEGPQGIAEFANEFLRTVLLHSDQFGKFDTSAAHDSRKKRSALAYRLRDFIFNIDEEALQRLVAELSANRERGLSNVDIIQRLIRLTHHLVERGLEGDSLNYRERSDLSIWISILVINLSRLASCVRHQVDIESGVDMLLVTLDQIFRQYQSIVIRDAADPLKDYWTLLESKSFQKQLCVDVVKQLIKTCTRLMSDVNGVSAPWASRFLALCQRSPKEESSDGPSIGGPFPFLNQIVDQKVITNSMRRAIANNGLVLPILLHGVDDTSKQFIARAIARAVLCERFKYDACGVCGECQAIEAGNSVALFEIDGRVHSAESFRETLKALNSTFGFQRVLVIAGIDLNHEFTDAFLEVFEMGRESTTFILLADRMEKLGDPIVSRCFPYRVRPTIASE